jgi:hypothetical protein
MMEDIIKMVSLLTVAGFAIFINIAIHKFLNKFQEKEYPPENFIPLLGLFIGIAFLNIGGKTMYIFFPPNDLGIIKYINTFSSITVLMLIGLLPLWVSFRISYLIWPLKKFTSQKICHQ